MHQSNDLATDVGSIGCVASEPRICLPTWRRFNTATFQSGLYEAQDVLAATDNVETMALEPLKHLRFREKWQRLLLYRDPFDKLMFANPGLQPIRLHKDYELFIVVCQSFWDLLYVNAIEGWRDRCRTRICWIDELYAGDVHGYKNWLRALEAFDYVFVSHQASATALEAKTGRPCHWLPAAVDTMRFSPYPDPPARVVDIYSIGRRWEAAHRALVRTAMTEKMFYLFDTVQGIANMTPFDSRQHREAYANIAKRSRFYVVAPAKMNVPSDTKGQSEIGHRYFEGTASGAVMIGQAPTTASFSELFGWQDSMISIRPDGADVQDVLQALCANPDRIREIHQRNSSESLRRHDWVYRWHQMLDVVGVAPSPGMIVREKALAALASRTMIDS